MQARRIALFLALLLLMTAAATSLVPPAGEPQPDPVGDGSTEGAKPVPGEESASAGEPGAGRRGQADAQPGDPVELEFAARGRPSRERVELDSRVIVTVTARAPGQVELAGLGHVQAVARRTPAVFDVYTDLPGRFDVVYEPVEGPDRRLGELIVRRSTAGGPSSRRPKGAPKDRPARPPA